MAAISLRPFRMTQNTSLTLDLTRWIAAFMVFASHFSYLGTSLVGFETVEPIQHLGVLLFFVMSGYLMQYVVEERHKGPRDYAAARWARINSVFIPALVITICADATGRFLAPEMYEKYPHLDVAHIAAYTPLFLTFLFENSVHPARWFTNGPLWSVAYEMWYYVLFGIYCYTRGKTRTLLLLVSTVLAGYPILLLMPVWLMGCATYKATSLTARMSVSVRRILAVGSFAAIAYFVMPAGHDALSLLRTTGERLTGPGFHAAFLSDYLVGLLLAIFIGAITSEGVLTLPLRLAPVVRWGANFSFSLYAFHLPLVIFGRATGLYDPGNALQCVTVAVMIVTVCWLLSMGTEHQKQVWRKISDQLFGSISTQLQRLNVRLVNPAVRPVLATVGPMRGQEDDERQQ